MLEADTPTLPINRSVTAIGMKVGGPWTATYVERYLRDSIVPLRLGVVDHESWPLIVSLWFLPDQGTLWCATQRSARIVKYLSAEPRCGFEVATNTPPYRGIRGRGRIAIEPQHGERILRELLRRYQGSEDTKLGRWLISRVEKEVAIRIEPQSITSWDFTRRMEEVKG